VFFGKTRTHIKTTAQIFLRLRMPSVQTLAFHARDANISFRVQLLEADNPDVVNQVLRSLPFESVLGHVVVSGEAIWSPTRIVHLGRGNMVKRTPGTVYLFAPGQSICLTYGSITESAPVNKFGQVVDEDMDALRKLGRIVWNNTVAAPRREIVRISIRSAS
jgi:hypothetical protein